MKKFKLQFATVLLGTIPHDREANGPLSRALGHDLHRRHRSSPVDDLAGMAVRRLYSYRNRRCADVHLVAVPGGEVRK